MQAFFDALKDESTADSVWFRGVKSNMTRMIALRKAANCESFDHSAEEIYLEHIKAICAAFAQADTAEAAARKLAVKTCWRACGRAAEPSALNYNSMVWNVKFQCAAMQSPQSKTSKCKYVVFPSGICRHSDWMLDFGDNLVFEARSLDHMNMVYPQGDSVAASELPWLLPDLQGDNSGTKLSNYIKGLQPGRAGLAKYAQVAVPDLPSNPTAAGIRPGAADTLACAVPAELGVHNTGHDLTGLSALWEYLAARVALLIPGAVALAGFPPLPYGQMGAGPAPPELSAVIGVDFEPMINQLFNLSDQSLPKLRQDGELRPLLRATLATMIMYATAQMTTDDD